MLHKNRLWSICQVDDPQELARMLTEHAWCLCTGFQIAGYLFLNDATSEDGAQEYAVVKRITRGGETTYAPRSSRDVTAGDAVDGYLYVSTDFPWPADPIKEGRLPDSWVGPDDATLPNKVKYLPKRVRVDVAGHKVDVGGVAAAFIPAPFTFCLACQVSYEQVRGRDFSKLVTLDAEGRSSAISVLSTSLVRALRDVPADELPADARKLLTFVDNRQDASLQAGHLNDFVQVAQLRGALHKAMTDAPGGLTHEVVAARVVNQKEQVMIITAEGIVTRTPVKEKDPRKGITTQGRSTQGVILMRLDSGDKVVALASFS